MVLSYETIKSINPYLASEAMNAKVRRDEKQNPENMSFGFGIAAQDFFNAVEQINEDIFSRKGEFIAKNELLSIATLIYGLAILLKESDNPRPVYLLLKHTVHELPSFKNFSLRTAQIVLEAFVP